MGKTAIRERTVAGRTIFDRITVRGRRPGGKRGARKNPSAPEVEAANARLSLRRLRIILNANFEAGDHFLNLTYAGDAPKAGEAREECRRFEGRLRAFCRKSGINLRWVRVTEYLNKRIHHHYVLSGAVPLSEVRRLWKRGGVHVTPLYGEDFGGLAEYLIKETGKTFREPGAPGKRRFEKSRSCVFPPSFFSEVSASLLFEEPKAVRGYAVDGSSVYRGRNPFSDLPYLEYVMVATGEAVRERSSGKKRRGRDPGYGAWLSRNGPVQFRMEGADGEEIQDQS